MAEIIESNAGRFLYIDGYLYCKYSGDFRRYWNCRRKGQCFARAVTTGYDDNLFVFQHVVGKHHPSLYAFFEELKKKQEESEGMLRQLGLGQRIRQGHREKKKGTRARNIKFGP